MAWRQGSAHRFALPLALLLLLSPLAGCLKPPPVTPSSRRALLLAPTLLPLLPSSSPASSLASSPAAPYDKYARTYDALAEDSGATNALNIDEARKLLLSRATGDVLELAGGTGINVPLYPPSVKSLTLVDLSPGMLDVAASKIAASPPPFPARLLPCDVSDMSALFPAAGSFDTVACTFSLCVLSPTGARAALGEARRLLRKGGRLLLLENAWAGGGVGAYQDAVAGAAARFGGKGCVMNRRVGEDLRQAGWDVQEEGEVAGGIFRWFVAS